MSNHSAMISSQTQATPYDVIVIGAGGAGLMCAAQAARRGRKTLVLDHAKKIGGKILISGGGRCNFTNTGASPAQYVSENPHFCKSALARFPSESFVKLVDQYQIAYHEKKLGQLFCDGSAQNIVNLLTSECRGSGVEIQLNSPILKVSSLAGPSPDGMRFEIETATQTYACRSLVVATGGLSIPKIGATDLGYRLAKQFGLQIVPTSPALDGFVVSPKDQDFFSSLAGVSIDCVIRCNRSVFRENILFTHSGLSGPAALQASLHWRPGDPIAIDLLPGKDLLAWFLEQKQKGNRAWVKNLLGEQMSARLADALITRFFETRGQTRELSTSQTQPTADPQNQFSNTPLPQVSETLLKEFCTFIHSWNWTPLGTVGYSKAEVTRGGVDTTGLSSKTMEAIHTPGLYFIGEVVDVTGWLGGYNFQWAWASGWCAGNHA